MLIAASLSQGASGRSRLDDVTRWIDAWAVPLGPEAVPLTDAAGRVVASPLTAPMDLPPFDRAAVNGYALRADETVGASAYNPLPFKLQRPTAAPPTGCAVEVQSGDLLPVGTDAVARLEHAVPDAAGSIAIIVPVFPGSEVERAGSHTVRGSVLVGAGRRLGPTEIALLATAGLERLPVVRRPRVRCLLAADRLIEAGSAPVTGAVYDANGPMLAALVARDGGVAVEGRRVARDRTALRNALAQPEADIVLVAGGTGSGTGDQAAAALAQAGELAVHGVALRPGESAGAGRVSDAHVFLLPGTPAACLWAYELLAGRAIRRLAGLGPELPYPTRTLHAARKIVSEIGMLEVCPVQCLDNGQAVPMASFAEAGLAAAAAADGFVLVPEASEGYAQGAPVTVYLYPARRRQS